MTEPTGQGPGSSAPPSGDPPTPGAWFPPPSEPHPTPDAPRSGCPGRTDTRRAGRRSSRRLLTGQSPDEPAPVGSSCHADEPDPMSAPVACPGRSPGSPRRRRPCHADAAPAVDTEHRLVPARGHPDHPAGRGPAASTDPRTVGRRIERLPSARGPADRPGPGRHHPTRAEAPVPLGLAGPGRLPGRRHGGRCRVRSGPDHPGRGRGHRGRPVDDRDRDDDAGHPTRGAGDRPGPDRPSRRPMSSRRPSWPRCSARRSSRSRPRSASAPG